MHDKGTYQAYDSTDSLTTPIAGVALIHPAGQNRPRLGHRSPAGHTGGLHGGRKGQRGGPADGERANGEGGRAELRMMPEAADNTAGNAPPAHASPPGVSPVTAPPARHAPETARLYALDWKTFAAWCGDTGRTALPATPATVAAFLAATAGGKSAGALGRCAAAIADRHRQAGFSSPAADPAVRELLRAARRAATPRRPPPPRPAQLLRMAAACPGDLAGMRDRAVLLLAASGLGRAALVGLDAEQLRFSATAVELPDPGVGSRKASLRRAIPCGTSLATCPVRALEDWLAASDTKFGPVFRKIDRWGTIEQRRLGTDAIRRILARRTPRRRRHSRAMA